MRGEKQMLSDLDAWLQLLGNLLAGPQAARAEDHVGAGMRQRTDGLHPNAAVAACIGTGATQGRLQLMPVKRRPARQG